MDNRQNLRIYRHWAVIYDFWIPLLYGRARSRAIALLNLQAGERLLIPGVGTGLDLPHIPANVSVTGVDFSPDMLSRAKAKGGNARLAQMDAQALGVPPASFDALLFNLILTVVPDGMLAFQEGWQALKPGGRAVIFDKILPDGAPVTPARRLLGRLLIAIGTDPNRRLVDLISGAEHLRILHDEPSLLDGQYRILLLGKEER